MHVGGISMQNIWDAVGRFFGPSHNDQFATLMGRLAQTSVECAKHFLETKGQDSDQDKTERTFWTSG